MSTRKVNERTKFIEEKCQTLLTQMLRDEDNKYCVDCDAKGPRWASWNLGVFLCIRCAGIHRNLGVHISRVRSVNLDSWTPDQVVSLQQMGNSKARAVYEAQLPDGFRRPQTDSALESFIRAKYEHKKYMAREWVPLPLTKANWDKEIDEEMERPKRKKKIATTASISTPTGTKNTTVTVKSPIIAPLPKPKASSSPKPSRVLLDTPSDSLNIFGSPPTSDNGVVTKPTTIANDLSGGDMFSNFLSASPISTTQTNSTTDNINSMPVGAETSLAKEEQDFFNQVPTEKEKTKMTKDSILALYGNTPINSSSTRQFNGTHGGFSQFSTPALGYGAPQLPATNFGSTTIGAHVIPQAPNQNFVATPQNNVPPGLYNSQMVGRYQTQMLPTQPQSSFASFPPQSSQTFPPQQFAQATQPINTGIHQQFDNLNLGNVWQ